LAAIALVTMLTSAAINGYQNLTRPPVVISDIPPDAGIGTTAATDDTSTGPQTALVESVRAETPKKGERSPHSRSGKMHGGKIGKLTNPADGQIDVNTADSDELQRLPGVGPAMAQRIINARQSFGGFRSAQDLQEVRGIGPKKFAKLEPFVKT
jgi:competence protein ComEA